LRKAAGADPTGLPDLARRVKLMQENWINQISGVRLLPAYPTSPHVQTARGGDGRM
jgi:hypothetical protein